MIVLYVNNAYKSKKLQRNVKRKIDYYLGKRTTKNISRLSFFLQHFPQYREFPKFFIFQQRTSERRGKEREAKTSQVKFSAFEEGFCVKRRRRRRRRRKRAGFVREFFFLVFKEGRRVLHFFHSPNDDAHATRSIPPRLPNE